MSLNMFWKALACVLVGKVVFDDLATLMFKFNILFCFNERFNVHT